MKQDEEFYVVQKAFIKNGDKVLVLGDPKEGLDFPGGKIQKDETDLQKSLQREVREETKLEIKVGIPFMAWIDIFPSHHIFAGKKAYCIAYRCDYVSGQVVLSNEHDSFSWVTKDDFKSVDDGTSYFDILAKYFE